MAFRQAEAGFRAWIPPLQGGPRNGAGSRRTAVPKNDNGNNACRPRQPKLEIAKWFHCPGRRRRRDNEQPRRQQRPDGRQGQCAGLSDGEGWTRLAGGGERNVTRFAAVRTVVEAVGAEVDIALAFADGAVLLAGAGLFGLVALHANNLLIIPCHGTPEGELYLRGALSARAGGRPISEEHPQKRERAAELQSGRCN
jgi:hypothetical protein